MFSKSFAVYLFICLLSAWLLCVSNAIGVQAPPTNQPVDPNQSAVPTSGLNNDSNGYAARTPVQIFVDPASGQQYGRYVINEPVPVLTYSYQEVKESVYRPKTVTELRTTTVTQYIPIQSQQLQLRNVTSWNPFAPPQQVWQYVTFVQYQPNNVQVTQPVTFQRYEKEEVTRMVPVLSTETKQIPKFVDRALGPSTNGGNAIASNPNFYQQAAQIAQANRNAPQYPTRPINFPATPGYAYPNRNYVAQTPAPYYPIPNFNPIQNIASTPMPGGNPTQNQNLVIPAVPLRPNMQPNSAMAGYYGPGANGYAMASAPSGVYPNNSPYVSPVFKWPTFASGTGSLFGSSLFNSNRNANYVASNTPVAQPYLWGNSNRGELSFRPNSSPYAAQQSWGMTTGNTYRDPMQGGMPATVLR